MDGGAGTPRPRRINQMVSGNRSNGKRKPPGGFRLKILLSNSCGTNHGQHVESSGKIVVSAVLSPQLIHRLAINYMTHPIHPEGTVCFHLGVGRASMSRVPWRFHLHRRGSPATELPLSGRCRAEMEFAPPQPPLLVGFSAARGVQIRRGRRSARNPTFGLAAGAAESIQRRLTRRSVGWDG
jgi:hypothetical protein